MPRNKLLLLLLFVLFFQSCRSFGSLQSTQSVGDTHPVIDREFRAAWVASVANINWPSTPGLPVHKQKEEAIRLLDMLQQTNYNAVIFQVRPQGDALYESNLEPWSYYLTGEQGTPPSPYYDPLQFWIEEAHNRNLELHVWLNPYRAHHISGGPITDSSVVKTKSELVLPLVNGYWWFDPSLKGTQDHSHAVVMDIVKRYDIDGVHFDDYFYPYPSYNNNEDFPDDESWGKYQLNGGSLTRSDWRRKAVNDFIKRVYTSIKKEKPYVKFGLSPFGIWRPNNPPSIQGFDQYEKLYADAKKWLNEGWVDYFTPQLYWPVNQVPQSFPVLLNWWTEQNYKNRHLWPGMSLYRFEGEKKADEVINQIMISRGMLGSAPGTVHWSVQPLIESEALRDELLRLPFQEKALIPPMHWLEKRFPARPEVEARPESGGFRVKVEFDPEKHSHWIIYTKYNDTWSYKVINKYSDEFLISGIQVDDILVPRAPIPTGIVRPLQEIQITTVSRTGLESKPWVWRNHHE